MAKSKDKIKNIKDLKTVGANDRLLREYRKGTKLIDIFRLQKQHLKFIDFLNFLMSIVTDEDKATNIKNRG